ncbi:MAG TPA: hypothetical protein VM370_13850 [Candidatus Thermoplasmatota archaeon]|nr:hypothetical protein [Candidatus Thermoplasmatota archaeon]
MFARRLLLVAVVLAGCASAPSGPDAAAITDPSELARLIGEPIEQIHDHTDPAQHVGAYGLRLVAWDPLIPDEIGTEGFAAMRIVDDVAYIGTDGAHAGFLMVDVSDPAKPVLLSQYVTPGGASQEAVPSSDGNWVFLNLQRQPGAADLLADPARGTGTGIQIVDVSDRANPRFESFVPVELLGTHVMMYFEWQGKQYLVYNGQPQRQSLPTGSVYTPPPGNDVKIAEFTEIAGKRTLRPVGDFRLPDSFSAMTSQGCFPHDQYVSEHPITHQLILYVAHWDCGAVTVDLSDPSMPQLLDVDNVVEPSTRDRIHYFRPDPTPRGGRIVAYSGPEIDISPGEPGYLRSYDVTDPADIRQIGAWRLPGEVENDKPFVFSPHNFDFNGDVLALAHYHAGVWLLNISDPEHPSAMGYYFPHGNETDPYHGPEVWRKTPNFPEPYFPNVYEVKWHRGYILVSERGSGLYVLELAPGYQRP